jgi:hypothetical protein
MEKDMLLKLRLARRCVVNVGGYILLYLLCQEKYVEKYKLVGGVSFYKKGVG